NNIDLTKTDYGINSFEVENPENGGKENNIELRFIDEGRIKRILITKKQAKELFYSLADDLGIDIG
ncbi:MAG TPA: hypothetical protein VD905_21835, partial [Flavobacteriales bacterium]|nr:hypothetical protein [Flavobacteriales bacterium]